MIFSSKDQLQWSGFTPEAVKKPEPEAPAAPMSYQNVQAWSAMPDNKPDRTQNLQKWKNSMQVI